MSKKYIASSKKFRNIMLKRCKKEKETEKPKKPIAKLLSYSSII